MDLRFWRGLAVGALIGWALSAYGAGTVRQMRAGMAAVRAGRRVSGDGWRGWARRRRGVVPAVGVAGGGGDLPYEPANSRQTTGVAAVAGTGARRVWRAWRRRDLLTATGEPIVTQPADQAFGVRRSPSRP